MRKMIKSSAAHQGNIEAWERKIRCQLDEITRLKEVGARFDKEIAERTRDELAHAEFARAELARDEFDWNEANCEDALSFIIYNANTMRVGAPICVDDVDKKSSVASLFPEEVHPVALACLRRIDHVKAEEDHGKSLLRTPLKALLGFDGCFC